jgi:hypothetical protein
MAGGGTTDTTNVPLIERGEATSIRSSRTGGYEPTPSSKFPAGDKQVETGLGYERPAADRDTRKGAPASGGASISPASPGALKPANSNFRTVVVEGTVR